VRALAGTDVLIGPNPFAEELTIRPQADMRYMLFSVLGTELLSGMARGGASVTLPTAELAAGAYTLRCLSMDGGSARSFPLVKIR